MSDLISRKAAIDALARVAREKFNLSDEFNHYLAGLIDGENAIRQLPSAQPERKKGKWHRRFYPQIEMMVCSECQEEFSYDAETGIRDYNYCPNCGAKMEVNNEIN